MRIVKVLGIDLAKNSFQLHGVDEDGKVVLKEKISREKLLTRIVQMPKCLIGMEACGGSNHFAREFEKLGHDVKIMSAKFVKPFVKSNKNDANDAEAICEAVQRPNMRFVPIKRIPHQDIQSLHRVRSRLIKARTALINETRGLLAEYGLVVSKGASDFRKKLSIFLSDEEPRLSDFFKGILSELYEEYLETCRRIKSVDKKIEGIISENESCKRLSEIPGVGPLTATAVYAASGNANVFENGRHFAAWLGLVPKQASTGGKERLLGISKRGDKHIRSLLYLGSLSVVQRAERKKEEDLNQTERWIKKLLEKKHAKKVSIAVANKNARIMWNILAKGESYKAAA